VDHPVKEIVDRKCRLCGAAVRKDEAFSTMASPQPFDPDAGA
jgi:hypothetical protein